ncbi:hypothetical protein [Bradyrhizobium genosp. SA-3]|uniref:hypothetical protein n=1 Tax=Bradyrhizobium genosp. SA-3 TaxID=508868 RepID=UPI001FE2126C|nr:hypothetical protein [Bradyrhizobium genosp. SA-3]
MTPDRMESASVPETNDPNPDSDKPDTAKPDEARADGGLTRAYDRIKSAEEDLARLDRLVSGMERDSEGQRTSHATAGATAAATSGSKARRRMPKFRMPSFAIKA